MDELMVDAECFDERRIGIEDACDSDVTRVIQAFSQAVLDIAGVDVLLDVLDKFNDMKVGARAGLLSIPRGGERKDG